MVAENLLGQKILKTAPLQSSEIPPNTGLWWIVSVGMSAGAARRLSIPGIWILKKPASSSDWNLKNGLVYSPSWGRRRCRDERRRAPAKTFRPICKWGSAKWPPRFFLSFPSLPSSRTSKPWEKIMTRSRGGRLSMQLKDKGHFFFNGNREELIAMQD